MIYKLFYSWGPHKVNDFCYCYIFGDTCLGPHDVGFTRMYKWVHLVNGND